MIVYTGAVLMLFLFVVMLVGVSSTDSLVETIRGQRVAGGRRRIGFAVLLVAGIGTRRSAARHGPAAGQRRGGNVIGPGAADVHQVRVRVRGDQRPADHRGAGRDGAGAPRAAPPKPTQKELSRQRFKPATTPAPLPGPGTYARHNAVDMPALLPDGTPSELSVNPSSRRRRPASTRTCTASTPRPPPSSTHRDGQGRDAKPVEVEEEEQ